MSPVGKTEHMAHKSEQYDGSATKSHICKFSSACLNIDSLLLQMFLKHTNPEVDRVLTESLIA